MPEQIIAGLDIGTSAIRLAVGNRLPEATRGEIQIVGVAEVPAEGIHRGTITSIEDAVSSVSACMERAERLVGVPIERVLVGISGSHILAQVSKGVAGVSRTDGEIREEDVERAVEAARTVATPSNYEILHVIPKTFSVDGQGGIKDPLGMTGTRLEVDAEIIQGLSAQIKNITKCVYRTGLEIEELVFGILAASEVVTTARQKELGVMVVNIGAATTSLAVYEEGNIVHTAVLPIGSEHITSDMAIGLRTSIEVAERLKREFGTALPKEIMKREEMNLAELGAPEVEVVSRKYVAEIIEARVEEIFEKIDKELRRVERSGLLPAGAVLVGGGSKLHGVVEVGKQKLRLPVSLGLPISVTGISECLEDASLITAVGLVRWGADLRGEPRSKIRNAFTRLLGGGAGFGKHLQRWFLG